MAVETLGAATIVPPTPAGTQPRTVPTNAGVFQAEIAADSVTQQVQQVQESAPQPEASNREAGNEQSSQGQQSQEAAPRDEQSVNNEAPSENRGGNVNIEV